MIMVYKFSFSKIKSHVRNKILCPCSKPPQKDQRMQSKCLRPKRLRHKTTKKSACVSPLLVSESRRSRAAEARPRCLQASITVAPLCKNAFDDSNPNPELPPAKLKQIVPILSLSYQCNIYIVWSHTNSALYHAAHGTLNPPRLGSDTPVTTMTLPFMSGRVNSHGLPCCETYAAARNTGNIAHDLLSPIIAGSCSIDPQLSLCAFQRLRQVHELTNFSLGG